MSRAGRQTLSGQAAVEQFVQRAHAALGEVDYYRILGVSSAMTEVQIRDAYYRLAARLHPDVHGVDIDPEFRRKLTAVFSRVVEAYKVLTDPARRAAYDRGLARGHLRLRAGAELEEDRPEDAIRDPAARRFYKLAQAALEDGDARSALVNLRFALSVEPDSELLQRELEAAEKAAR